MEYKEYGIWTQESHLTWSDWLQKRLSPTQRHNLLCLWGIRLQLSKMFTPILSGKVSSNWPWNHETENYSLLKLYRLLCKNTVGIWLEINLASTKNQTFQWLPWWESHTRSRKTRGYPVQARLPVNGRDPSAQPLCLARGSLTLTSQRRGRHHLCMSTENTVERKD